MRRIDHDPNVVAAKLRRFCDLKPRLALILGSGFNQVTQALDIDFEIAYAELPGFPCPTARGHAGKLLIGRLAGTPVMVLSGRAHFYEGHDLSQVTFPIRVLAACQVEDLVLTNAAGGVSRAFRAGDFMIIRDHINLMGASPLRGIPAANGSPFVDLTCVYDPKLRHILSHAGKGVGIRLRTGVYLAVSGPNYETPAEIRAFARLGADAVGMSTVPEAIVARQCGVRVAGLSCITNLAAGRNRKPLSHAEVLQTGARATGRATAILMKFSELYGKQKTGPAAPRSQIRIEKPLKIRNLASGKDCG
jgi:purine-nucleoside phosphorylase